MNKKIDFIVTWVDGSDTKWLDEKKYWEQKIKGKSSIDSSKQRYRDMDTLKYWFRGVEKFAPWVNKIYFVTWGHYPEWLNIDNEKLVIVKHSDFIPKEKLPTFNSNAIEEYFHLIPELSENFVYFNDDMFIINPTKEKDFFKDNIPCDCMTFAPLLIQINDMFHKKICNDLEIINKHFDFEKCMKKNKKKYLSLKQKKYILRTLSLMNYKSFVGFQYYHLPVSYNKTTFKKVWEKEHDILDKTSNFKFRNNYESVNHWLFEYWQFAEGNFIPRRSDFGKCIRIDNENIDKVLNSRKYKVVCVNDSYNNFDFDEKKNNVISIFEKKFNEKSMFEK